MRYKFCDRVFSKKSNDLSILFFLHESVNGRLYLDLEDVEGLHYNEWRTRTPQEYIESWDLMLEWSVRDAAVYPTTFVVVDDIAQSAWDPVSRLNLHDASTLARCGFSIIIENGRNDRAFILSMIDRSTRGYLLHLESIGVLRFQGVGGVGEIKAYLEEIVNRKPNKAHSYFVMIDSDADAPGMISNAAKQIYQICGAAQVPFYCLEKRSIENYIPVPTLFDYIGDVKRSFRPYLRDLANALKKISADQRAHFPMKSGIKNFSQAQKGLYGTLDEQTLLYLKRRFPDKLATSVFSETPQAHLERQIDGDSGKDEIRVMVADVLRYARGPYA